MRKYIYGAGFNCEKYLERINDLSEIVGILDRNQEKWNSKKMGISIVPVETIEEKEFDRIIIAVANYISIADLLMEKGVEIEKISVYNIEKNIVIPLSEIYENDIEKRIYRKRAICQIKRGLLMEAYRNKEFQDTKIVSVFGEEQDFQLIKEFFEETGTRIKVAYKEMYEQENYMKYILCGSNYKNVLKKIREKQHNNKQWIILPLYDVESSLNWK